MIGVFAVYCVFVVFVYAVLRRDGNADPDDTLLSLFSSPGRFWDRLLTINAHGWARRDGDMTGVAAWLHWSADAMLIVGIAMVTAVNVAMMGIFCEQCRRWYKCVEEGWIYLGEPSDASIRSRIRDGDLTPLETLPACTAADSVGLRVDLWMCIGCREPIGVEVYTRELRKVGRKGELKTVEKRLGRPFLVPGALCAHWYDAYTRGHGTDRS